jgi:hypothetical protein
MPKKYDTRLKKIENELAKHRTELKIIWQNCDETSEEAMARAGVDADDDDLVVYVVRWGQGPPEIPIHSKPEPTVKTDEDIDLDTEIKKIKAELINEGYTEKELTADESLGPKPIRVDDLVSITRKK